MTEAKVRDRKARTTDAVRALSENVWLVEFARGMAFVRGLAGHARRNGWDCRKLNLYGMNGTARKLMQVGRVVSG